MPGVLEVLNGSDWYVVQSDEEVQLVASPPGVVSVTVETGPIRLRGTFADGGGKVETRVYQKKHVFVVERLKAGQVELLLVPKGKIERRVLGDGTDPIPPPEPVKSFRVVFVVESGDTLTAAQTSVIYGEEVEKFLSAKCTNGRKGWFRRDKDGKVDQLDATMQALWKAVQAKVTATPCVAVAVNEKVEIIDLAATPAAMIARFKEYLGEK